MKVEVFYYASDMYSTCDQCNSAISSLQLTAVKTQLMYSTILLWLFVSKYDINGSRLNYSTMSKNKF